MAGWKASVYSCPLKTLLQILLSCLLIGQSCILKKQFKMVI